MSVNNKEVEYNYQKALRFLSEHTFVDNPKEATCQVHWEDAKNYYDLAIPFKEEFKEDGNWCNVFIDTYNGKVTGIELANEDYSEADEVTAFEEFAEKELVDYVRQNIIENLKANEKFAFKDSESGYVFEFEKDSEYRPDIDKDESNIVIINLYVSEDQYEEGYPHASTDDIHVNDLKSDIYKERFLTMDEKLFMPYSPEDIFYLSERTTLGVPHVIWMCNYAEVDNFTGEKTEQEPFVFIGPLNEDFARMQANRILSKEYEFVEYDWHVCGKDDALDFELDNRLSETEALKIVKEYKEQKEKEDYIKD